MSGLVQWPQGFENVYYSASQIVPRRGQLNPTKFALRNSSDWNDYYIYDESNKKILELTATFRSELFSYAQILNYAPFTASPS